MPATSDAVPLLGKSVNFAFIDFCPSESGLFRGDAHFIGVNK